MINNRQAGRRRGRNNSRPNNNGGRGGGDSGNRIDSRARGNAAQLLEKYRNMARDAQMAGDRVNMEYYLQFADHYFRVLADNRSRQEEQQNRQQPRAREGDDYFPDEMDGDVGGEDDPFSPRISQPMTRADTPRSDTPRDDSGQEDRPERAERQPREAGERQNREQADRERDDRDGNEGERERRPRRPRRDASERAGRERADEGEAQGGFDVAVLPPSIVQADNDAAPAEEVSEEAAPRRRTRRPRAAPAEAAE